MTSARQQQQQQKDQRARCSWPWLSRELLHHEHLTTQAATAAAAAAKAAQKATTKAERQEGGTAVMQPAN